MTHGADSGYAIFRRGKREGEPATVQGFYNILRETKSEVDLERGVVFEQDWASLNTVMPVASGGIPAGATAHRVALECMILARNAARDIVREGPESLRDAAKWCSPLETALDTWGDITFNSASTDTLDYAPTPSVSA